MRRSRIIRPPTTSATAVVTQMISVASTYVAAPLIEMPEITMFTTISATIVEARASRPAKATEGWRMSTLTAKKLTMMWTIQKRIVASTIAVVEAEKSLNKATDRTSPAAMPIRLAARRMTQRPSMVVPKPSAYSGAYRDRRRFVSLVPHRYHPEMAMNLRLSAAETEALRSKAAEEGRSMQEVARTAIAQYTSDRQARLALAISRVRDEDAELLERLRR